MQAGDIHTDDMNEIFHSKMKFTELISSMLKVAPTS